MKFKTAGASIELDSEWVKKMTPLLNGQPIGLYARISGQKSLDGSSLESQIAVNRRFALDCGAIVRAEKTEVITGVFITARSEFNALLQLADKGEIKFIIVDVRDRLGRGDAISVLEFLARQAGVKIVYATQPADLDTYEGAALDATETLVSRIERLNIRRRTNRGRREWSSEGRIFTGRFFPYGYRIKMSRDEKGRLQERTLVIHEPEAETVRCIFQWFVYEDLTTYMIAMRLHRGGVPVPEGHLGRRNGKPHHWYTSTIERIIKNETYAGIWHYGKMEMKKYEAGTKIRYKQTPHPAEHRIPISVPALVSRELWNAAQVVMKRHARGGQPPKHQYLLRGILRCIKSNANMTGQTVKDPSGAYYGYYTCPHRSISIRFDPNLRCQVRQLNQKKVEYWVWGTLMKLAKEPEQIEKELEQRRQREETAGPLVRQALAGVETQIAGVNQQKADLLDLYLSRGSGGELVSRENYEVKIRQLNEQLVELETRITQIQEKLKTDTIAPEQISEAKRLLRIVRVADPLATFVEKRALLRLLDIQVFYDGDKLELVGCIPTRNTSFEELRQIIPPHEISSLLLQSEPSDGSQPEAEGNSTLSDRTHNMGCRRD